jgi:hypothetical protein
MRPIVRLLLVLSVAMGLAAGVIYVERSYRPRTGWGLAQVVSEHPDYAVSDAEAEAAFGGLPKAGAPAAGSGRPLAGPPSARLPEKNGTHPDPHSNDSATGPARAGGTGRKTASRGADTPPAAENAGASPAAQRGQARARTSAAGRLVADPAVQRALADVEQPAANRPTMLRETVLPAAGVSGAGERVWQVDVVDDPARHTASEASAGIRRAELFDLVRDLRAADPRAAAARAELLRRGLTEVDLELGRRLFDPDPEVRRQLVRALPALQSVDVAPWLLRLCQDEDPEVRAAAMALAGTTADPRLLEQVEALARQDSDDRIRDLADQLATQRDILGARAGGVARLQPRRAPPPQGNPRQ